uniref:Uncharacterized protein n=1 Tax=Neobodo designis TaxID=312471 RepID=A0A7S1LTM8_NEODS
MTTAPTSCGSVVHPPSSAESTTRGSRGLILFLIAIGAAVAVFCAYRPLLLPPRGTAAVDATTVTDASVDPPPATVHVPSTDNPTVGVCITGGSRAFHVTRHVLWADAVEALQPNPARRHVIFETAPAGADCAGTSPAHASRGDADGFAQTCRAESARSNRLLTAFARQRGANVSSDDALSCAHPLLAGHACCARRPHAMRDAPAGVWGMASYARKLRCAERLAAFERKHNVAFDFVVWLRPDLHFFEPLPPAAHLQRLIERTGPRVFVPAASEAADDDGQASISDDVAIVPRQLLHRWHDALLDSVAVACPDETASTNGRGEPTNGANDPPAKRLQRVLDARLDDSRLSAPYEVLPMPYAIARTDQRADCSRLVGKNSLDGDGKTRATLQQRRRQRIADLCRQRFPGDGLSGVDSKSAQALARSAMPPPPERRPRPSPQRPSPP